MENKFRKEMQNPLIQLKLKMIRDNVNRWDTLWVSYEGRYKEMSEDEIKAKAADGAEEKNANDRNGSNYQEMRKKELQSKSLKDLTLDDMLEIQQMNGMPCSPRQV